MAGPAEIVAPTLEGGRGAHPQPGARGFVWVVYAAMTIAALGMVHGFGYNFPFGDDWAHISALTGHRPVLPWLWAQHNEHRIPVPKLILLGLGRFTNYDFRAGMYFNVALLAALAAVMILAARTARGSTSYADAFFPVVLLSWGNLDNLLWNFQVGFVVPAVLAAALLLLIVGKRPSWTVRPALVGGTLFLLLPLTGAPGLITMAALTPWLGVEIVSRWRRAEPREGRALLWLGSLVAASLIVAMLYFYHYKSPASHQPPPSKTAALVAGLEALSLSFGSAGFFLWPYSAAIVVCLFLVLGVVLVRTWLVRPAERHRVFGLVCFMVSIAGLALAVGWGRAFLGHGGGAAGRYATLVAPGVCCAYFVFLLYCRPALASCGQMVLLVVAVLMLPLNVFHAVQFGTARAHDLASLEHELRRGVPCSLLAKRIRVSDPHPTEESLVEGMRCLAQAGAGPFRFLKQDAPVRKASVPILAAAAVPEPHWAARERKPTSRRLIALPSAQLLYAVDVTFFSAEVDWTAGPLCLFWRPKIVESGTPQERSYSFSPNAVAGRQTVRIPVYDTVDEIWIDLSERKKTVAISKVEIVLEKDTTERAARP